MRRGILSSRQKVQYSDTCKPLYRKSTDSGDEASTRGIWRTKTSRTNNDMNRNWTQTHKTNTNCCGYLRIHRHFQLKRNFDHDGTNSKIPWNEAIHPRLHRLTSFAFEEIVSINKPDEIYSTLYEDTYFQKTQRSEQKRSLELRYNCSAVDQNRTKRFRWLCSEHNIQWSWFYPWFNCFITGVRNIQSNTVLCTPVLEYCTTL